MATKTSPTAAAELRRLEKEIKALEDKRKKLQKETVDAVEVRIHKEFELHSSELEKLVHIPDQVIKIPQYNVEIRIRYCWCGDIGQYYEIDSVHIRPIKKVPKHDKYIIGGIDLAAVFEDSFYEIDEKIYDSLCDTLDQNEYLESYISRFYNLADKIYGKLQKIFPDHEFELILEDLIEFTYEQIR